MGSSNQQTQSATNTQPWSTQIPYLTQAFQGASSALGNAQRNGVAPTGFVAGMTPQQMALFGAMTGYGTNNPIPGQEAGLGTNLTDMGMGATSGALGGLSAFNPANFYNMGSAIAGGNAYAAGLDIPGQVAAAMRDATRSEERRVGKEGRCEWARGHKKQKRKDGRQ